MLPLLKHLDGLMNTDSEARERVANLLFEDVADKTDSIYTKVSECGMRRAPLALAGVLAKAGARAAREKLDSMRILGPLIGLALGGKLCGLVSSEAPLLLYPAAKATHEKVV